MTAASSPEDSGTDKFTMLVMSRPGRPLHLAVWVHDRAEHQPDGWYTGRHVPICGQDRGRPWQITGPWAEHWERDNRGALCSRCAQISDRLTAGRSLFGDH